LKRERKPGRPVMLRAGGWPTGTPALTAKTATYLADISEFEPDLNDAAYLAWSQAIVIRALYGTAHEDGAWYGGARRADLHAGGVRFLGIYAYLTQDEDAAAQAEAFVNLVGPLEPGEMPVCDLEEGAGDQSGRWQAWAAVITAAYGISPWLYSGLDFAAARNLRPQWVAAYQQAEPAIPHLLWQFTDSFQVPGAGRADCSVFWGTAGQLAALAWQPAPPPASATGDDMPAGVIETDTGMRESHTWAGGTASQIVLYSDWQGLQPAPPVVAVRVASLSGQVIDAGQVTVNGTAQVDIAKPGDCNGCSFERIDAGPATVAYHTNA
jgi:Glycosyl hydrolases family 25